MRISDWSSDVCSSDLTETYGERDTALAVIDADPSLVRFYLPPETRWAVASGREPFQWPKKEAPKTLGEQLTTTVRRIVTANTALAGVIDTVDFNETRNADRHHSQNALQDTVQHLTHPPPHPP